MRKARTHEERIAEIEKSIAWHEHHITALKEKLEKMQNPQPRARGKVGMATVVRKAKEQGVSATQLLEMMEHLEESNS